MKLKPAGRSPAGFVFKLSLVIYPRKNCIISGLSFFSRSRHNSGEKWAEGCFMQNSVVLRFSIFMSAFLNFAPLIL
ncbi:hypothetical protein EDL98_09435 [Ornithobacterium rhinotracheale]|nr:hypothetical protein [Ornithobacterium rhinotracheale]